MDITSVIVYLKGLIGTIITFLLMLSPVSPAGVAFDAEKPDELITSFAVVSDIHVETNNPDSYNAYRGVLEGIKAGNDIRTSIFLGDNVMNGQELENIFFYTALKAVNPAENNIVVICRFDFFDILIKGTEYLNNLFHAFGIYRTFNHQQNPLRSTLPPR